MKSDLVTCTAMLCLVLGLLSMHMHGINGVLTVLVISAVTGLGGYEIGKKEEPIRAG